MVINTKKLPTRDVTENYLEGLNEVQKIAVMHTEGPSLIIAGAGSGKTRILTYRIAYILKEKKADPHQILALTFTNKAAAEMRSRIEKVVAKEAKALWLGTFHSVFLKLLRKEAASLGYPSHFSIYDQDDSKSLIKHVIKKLNLDDKVYKPNVVFNRISHAKNRLITAEMYAENGIYQKEDTARRMPQLGEIFIRYMRHCAQANAMDLDDILLHTYRLLDHFPDIHSKYQQQFRYLLIDEFQDTNLLQYSIIKQLSYSHQNICVVGDDAQSIYAFRGADIRNILNFSSDYPNHKVTKLEQNYRSTQYIVEAANSIISYNQFQLKKKVWTSNAPGEPIGVLKSRSDVEESNLVVDTLLEQKLRNQLSYQDFAILYRTNNQSRLFEETLRRKDIPYRIVGGLSFYQKKEIKDLIAYFRFVVNHSDTEAFKRIINFPRRGIGPLTIDKIYSFLEEKKISLWDTLHKIENFLGGSVLTSVSRFVAFVKSAALKLDHPEEDAYSIAAYIAKESGLLKELYEDKTVEGLSRYEHIQELLNSLKQFVDDPDNKDPSLGNFLHEIALITAPEGQNTEEKDMVTLMTIHASKGLEFKYVYLVGMEEDLFPSALMVGTQADLEEERRLCYVAVTRAQVKLTLSYTLSRYRFGQLITTEPSRFLDEIGSLCKEEQSFVSQPIAKKTSISRLLAGRPFPHTTAPPMTLKKEGFGQNSRMHRELLKSTEAPLVNGEVAGLQVGSQVRHLHFGQGKVIQLINAAGLHKAVVFFDSFGEKTLLLKYAQLEVLSTTS